MNKQDTCLQDIQLNHYKSLESYEKSLEKFGQLKNGFFAAQILLKIANLYQDLNDYEKAIENFKLALKLYQDENSYLGEGLTLKSIGEMWKERKGYSEAREIFWAILKGLPANR